MKRPIVVAIISYIIGILGGLYLKSIAFIFFIFAVIILFMCIRKINNKYFRLLRSKLQKYSELIIIFFILFGYIYMCYTKESYNYVYEDGELVNEYCIVIGKKDEYDYNASYKVKIVNSKNKKRNGTFLYIKVRKSNIEYGDLLFITGTYIEPDVRRNEGGFYYKEYLKTLKIYGTVEVNSYNVVAEKKISKILLYSNELKMKLKQNVGKVITKEENKNLLIGMVLGDTEKLDEKIEEAFLNSNLIHILSVSGGQVSNIILGVTILLGSIKIDKKIIYVICIFILFVFMVITGFTPSIVRACIMGIINLLSIILLRRNDLFNSFGISLFIILIDNPYGITSLSVLLSYFGFFGMITLGNFITDKINKKLKSKIIKYFVSIVISSISAQIFILPIILYIFGTISLTFIFSNLLVIPLSSVITIMGFFIMLCPLPILKIISPIIDLSIYIAKFFASINISKIYFIIPNMLEIVCYYIIVIYMYYLIRRDYLFRVKHFFRKNKYKIFFIICIFFIVIRIYYIFPKQLKLNFIDVGQGDSTLITTSYSRKILIDGGGSEFFSDFDVGEKTLLPYLLKKKILKLDYIIISHFDSDHIGGLFTIIEELKVDNIIIGRQFEDSENYEKFKKLVKQNKIKVNIVEAGQRINIDKYTYIDILWPSAESKIRENSINNNSLVCKLVCQDFSVLFTGDIEEMAEKAIINKYKNNLNILEADILKVAHHGSKTSSHKNFLNIVKPKIALIGVGEDNKFGHPSDIVIDNLKSVKADIFRTDENGEISITTDKKKKRYNIEKLIK